MEVENFQSLSMAEKLRLWKLKTGRASNSTNSNSDSSSASSSGGFGGASRTKSSGSILSSKKKSPNPKIAVPSIQAKSIALMAPSVTAAIKCGFPKYKLLLISVILPVFISIPFTLQYSVYNLPK